MRCPPKARRKKIKGDNTCIFYFLIGHEHQHQTENFPASDKHYKT